MPTSEPAGDVASPRVDQLRDAEGEIMRDRIAERFKALQAESGAAERGEAEHAGPNGSSPGPSPD